MFWDFTKNEEEDAAKLWPVHQMNDTEKPQATPEPSIMESPTAPSAPLNPEPLQNIPAVPETSPVPQPLTLDTPTVPAMDSLPTSTEIPVSQAQISETGMIPPVLSTPEISQTLVQEVGDSLNDAIEQKRKELTNLITGLDEVNKNTYGKELGAKFGNGSEQIFVMNGTVAEPHTYTVITTDGYRTISFKDEPDSLSHLIAVRNMDQDSQEAPESGVSIQDTTGAERLYIEWGNDVKDFDLKPLNPDQADSAIDKKLSDVEAQRKQRIEQARQTAAAETDVAKKFNARLAKPTS